jgi:hypothetical protein
MLTFFMMLCEVDHITFAYMDVKEVTIFVMRGSGGTAVTEAMTLLVELR